LKIGGSYGENKQNSKKNKDGDISKSRMEELMLNTGFLTKDLGTILVGSEAVNEGIINLVEFTYNK